MNSIENKKITHQDLAKNLASFAIDRKDLKEILAALPRDHGLNLTAIEYELGILKILSVGWGISFYMAASDKSKAPVSRSFWEIIREISQNISTLTETTTGKQIDYFAILKERLDTYLEKMQANPNQATDPTAVIGPMFADACGCSGNAIAILTGTKMFTLTLGSVKEYLNAVKVEDIKFN
ncbi:hypothetical protein [Desulfospira joergensenii]|uniref:hypothetical protein n=1 Tax=Desulfospira joergensenii TaxID=53329 RepID=UPI0003B54508|nr:hypothetical protein [Desulfospira joergensenii]